METVRVIYHRETDGWWGRVARCRGWSAGGDSYAEVANLVDRDDLGLGADLGVDRDGGREAELVDFAAIVGPIPLTMSEPGIPHRHRAG